MQQRGDVKTSGLSFVFGGQNYDEMLMMLRVLHLGGKFEVNV